MDSAKLCQMRCGNVSKWMKKPKKPVCIAAKGIRKCMGPEA